MNLLLQSFLNDKSAPYIILGAGLLLITYVIIRPFMKRKQDPMKPNFARNSLSKQRTVERQMESLLVELSEMTRQMTAQIDTRAAKLELLIKEADEKIGRMEQLAQDQAMERQTERFTDRTPSIATAPTALSPIFAAPAPAPAAPVSEIDRRHSEIYALADAGKSISEIASAVGQPSGEIELILALRRG